MKKIIQIAILIILFTQFAIAQNTGKKGSYGMADGGYKPNRQIIKTNYEERSSKNKCFENFDFTVKNYGYNKDGNFYSWGIRVKNNYREAVQLNYKLIVGNDKPTNGTLTYNIKPGETYDNDFGLLKALIVGNNSNNYRIEVSDVCFEGQDCIKNGYATCGGIGKKINNSSNTAANNGVNNSNNTRNFNFPNLMNKYNDLCNEANNSNNSEFKNAASYYCNLQSSMSNNSLNIEQLNQNINSLENLKNNYTKKMQNTTTSSCGAIK